jgi:hypothetical protein
MVGISVGGVDLGINPSTFNINPSTGAGGTILDSGTTISMLTLPAYEAVLEVSRFSRHCSSNFAIFHTLFSWVRCSSLEWNHYL